MASKKRQPLMEVGNVVGNTVRVYLEGEDRAVVELFAQGQRKPCRTFEIRNDDYEACIEEALDLALIVVEAGCVEH